MNVYNEIYRNTTSIHLNKPHPYPLTSAPILNTILSGSFIVDKFYRLVMRRVTLLQMLPPQALLATILFFQFFRSGVSTTTITPAVTSSPLSAISSASSNQRINASKSSYITETPSANHNFSATSVAKAGDSSRTVVNGGDSSVLPTKSSAPSVNQTVSIAYSKRICTFRINNPDSVLLNINTKKTMTVS